MKDIRVEGRLQRVFVLKETDVRTVYIPLKSLTRKDYERLLEIEGKGGEMLTEMRRTTLDNGRNALAQYDSIIQVVTKLNEKEGTRLRKPDEPQAPMHPMKDEPKAETIESQDPPKRKRGRPPKQKQETDSQE